MVSSPCTKLKESYRNENLGPPVVARVGHLHEGQLCADGDGTPRSVVVVEFVVTQRVAKRRNGDGFLARRLALLQVEMQSENRQ